MKRTNLKTKISIITAILILLISVILATLPISSGQYVYTKTAHAIIGAVPNPVGVNQEILLHIGITDFLQAYTDGWEGLTATVTRPDGQTETLGPFRTDSTGGTGTVYIPTMVGKYTFQTHFPAQSATYSPTSRIPFDGEVLYDAANSEVLEVIVQQEPIQYYPGHSMPSEYWSRPIDAQLWEWSPIAGSWGATPPGKIAPYNDGPETAHILWTRPEALGGLSGGEFGPQSMECGDAYEGRFQRSVILNGIFYYHRFTDLSRGGNPSQGLVAVDLHTGEELWFKNNTAINHGQLFYWDSFNYHGVFAYLWEPIGGGDWRVLDAFTGEWVYTLEDAPISVGSFGRGGFGSRTMFGPKGEIYSYTMDINDGWMTLWNSSSAVQPQETGGSGDGSWGRQISRKSSDRIIDALDTGIAWNVTIPNDLDGSGNVYFYGDRVIGTNAPGGFALARSDVPIEMWCLSLKPGQEGTLLWRKTWQPPPGDVNIGWGAASLEDGVFVLQAKETRQHYGFDINTGNQIWGPTEPLPYQAIYGIEDYFAYGKLLAVARMAGITHAYDVNTGNLLWSYGATDEFSEVLWANDWSVRPVFITDGKLYMGQTEHSPVDPKPRGAPFVCVDIDDGTEIWRADGMFRQTDWGGMAIIADSIIVTEDSYDQRIYAIGKGPTVTTIEPMQGSISSGSDITILGRVTDISPGTEEYAIRARFPNGVPAVSDASMSDWMLYIYKQFGRPVDAVGVPVKIEIVDPNGQYAWIGTETTDTDGNYGYSWRPTIEGKYTVIATFDGSAGYYGSHAMTYLTVGPAVSPSTPITPETPATPLITTEIAVVLVAAIAAIVIIAFLALRKRK
jgi:outer membrane protein assembly factor BamB